MDITLNLLLYLFIWSCIPSLNKHVLRSYLPRTEAGKRQTVLSLQMMWASRFIFLTTFAGDLELERLRSLDLQEFSKAFAILALFHFTYSHSDFDQVQYPENHSLLFCIELQRCWNTLSKDVTGRGVQIKINIKPPKFLNIGFPTGSMHPGMNSLKWTHYFKGRLSSYRFNNNFIDADTAQNDSETFVNFLWQSSLTAYTIQHRMNSMSVYHYTGWCQRVKRMHLERGEKE